MIYAPIIIPTLCRSKHFIRLMESLKKNTWACYTDVYVGLDYPPSEKYEAGWREISDYLEGGDFSVFRKFTVFKRECNYGSSKNVRNLMHYVRDRYDRWIRTDDDCEFSPNFLEYMDKCLFEYEKNEDIIAVTGYSYPINWSAKKNATCFLQNFNAAVWGAGFWKNKQQGVREHLCNGNLLKDAVKCVKEKSYKKMIDACLVDYFGAVGSLRHPSKLMMGMTDVALRAYLAIENKYFISPIVSKVRNHGFDGSGCFCDKASGDGFCKARSFDYSKQVIDGGDSFEISLDDSLQYLDENRCKLNEFDSRSVKDVLFVRRMIWLIDHLGLWAAKLYHGFFMLLRRVKKI